MLKFLGKLFGSEKMVDAGIAAGDAAFFTKEERSEWTLNLLKAYEPFKLAQRFLAFIFCVPYALLASGMIISELFFSAEIDESLRLLNETFGGPCSIIVAFYFGGGLLEGAINASKQNAAKGG